MPELFEWSRHMVLGVWMLFSVLVLGSWLVLRHFQKARAREAARLQAEIEQKRQYDLDLLRQRELRRAEARRVATQSLRPVERVKAVPANVYAIPPARTSKGMVSEPVGTPWPDMTPNYLSPAVTATAAAVVSGGGGDYGGGGASASWDSSSSDSSSSDSSSASTTSD